MTKKEIAAKQARQGEISGRVRVVLAVSTIGAVVGLAAVFFIFARNEFRLAVGTIVIALV